MFQIEVKTGDAGVIIMRGCPDGTVEFCKSVDKKDSVTGIKTPELVPYKFYANIEQAFNRVFGMRVCSAEATNIKDLVSAVKAIRSDIKQEMGALV